MADAPPIESYVERFRERIVQKALPLWAAAGFDAERGSFVERLTLEGMPLVSTPRSAMVQARQIYVFSHAAFAELAAGSEAAGAQGGAHAY